MLAQDLIDEVNGDVIDYDYNEITDEEAKEVMLELEKAIFQELTIPIEDRDIYWAQTLIDSV